MPNTLSTRSQREKYLQSQYDVALRRRLVSRNIFSFDESNTKTIENPYGSTATATIQAIAGTYTVSTWTTTDDTLTVTDEVVVSEHIYRHDEVFSRFDIGANRLDAMVFAVVDAIDKYAINVITSEAGQVYTTPLGGFSQANIGDIMANLISLVQGYEEVSNGMFLVLESTDTVGFIQMGINSGFNFADAVLNNGFFAQLMGVELYVTRPGLFVTATLGTKAVANANHRLFGIKGVATVAQPGGITYDEKPVSGKTGREIEVSALVGAHAWATKSSLLVDITLA